MPNNQKTTKIIQAPAPESAKNRLAELNRVINKYFFEFDLQAFRLAMGAMQAHFLGTGDPSWLFVVAPPATGKTTVAIMANSQLPQVVPLSGFTPQTFLSGYSGEREPGLLEKLGETKEEDSVFTTTGDGIILCKDFTTVLSMRRETRAEILSQLREIHDGEFSKAFGTGVTKKWRGRITMIAAVTPAIDRFSAVFSVLGERFLQVRWPRSQSPRAGQMAIQQQGSELAIREALQRAVKVVFDNATTTAPKLDGSAAKRLASAAELVAIGRTHVYRNSYGNREIESTPQPEGNSRIAKGLAGIAKGVASLNGRRKVEEADLQDVFRVAIDTIPDIRRKLLLSIIQGKFESVNLPRTVKTRELEELEALGLITKKGATPQLTRSTSKLLRTAGIATMNGAPPKIISRPRRNRRLRKNVLSPELPLF